METIDISGRIKNLIRFGLILTLATAGVVGYGVFEHYHAAKELRIDDAKVTGTMVSVRTLVNGQVSEFLVEDGAEVKAGDVIARLKVSVSEEDIQQLQSNVEQARANYEELQKGKWVTVPVKKTRAVQRPVTSTTTNRVNNSANLASLKERAERMNELFAMGAVSAKQRDAAVQAYNAARSNQGSTYTTNSTSYETTYIEEVEYVEQFQPTPPAVLTAAENAVKQAELSLNVALQEAQQTEIFAPVDGMIYYSAEVDKDLNAGDIVAKVGDSNELWLAAEVNEDTFNKVSLGKLVNYSIDGKNLTGIVVEKIKPDPVVEEPENVWQPPTDENPTSQVLENQTDAPPHNDKFILRVSLPEERDFECQPNSTTTLKIKM